MEHLIYTSDKQISGRVIAAQGICNMCIMVAECKAGLSGVAASLSMSTDDTVLMVLPR